MPSTTQQSTKPQRGSIEGQQALLGYLFGPGLEQIAPDFAYDPGANPFPRAGQAPGTVLPNWADLQETASGNFFEGVGPYTKGTYDPFSQAMNTVLNPAPLNFGGAGGGGGFGGGGGQASMGPEYQQALDQLMNAPSLFDSMSGGPIVDRISSLADEQATAVEDRAMANLAKALDVATAEYGGNYGSALMQERGRITTDVVNDLNVFLTTQRLDTTKYLGQLALEDAQQNTNRLQVVLQSSLTKYGIDSDTATKMAKIYSDQAIQAAGIQAQYQLGQQSNALGLLGQGQQAFQNTQQNQLALGTKPLDMLMQLAVGVPTIGGGSSKAF